MPFSLGTIVAKTQAQPFAAFLVTPIHASSAVASSPLIQDLDELIYHNPIFRVIYPQHPTCGEASSTHTRARAHCRWG